ncbi:helix-turn-helix transcriptional regulator [Streptomyces sp. DSM 44917]|uniref:Helix-turn-helix transcriptional regulator n=2 Tax=Streptomyces boetiae TaxID=3075541 RepID=A0ABU2L7S6_9ACTN|nr:helix-turn-helix transcriptional regulator [Streptomyces sp. DSM 44917]MDT0307630.1 helix-turn-helix transcriptional regulator [Streptomyces sp. DSM 44917]
MARSAGAERGPGAERGAAERRRPELAAFLRGRRARITPADVGLPPGPRRRTPGLRREEVAQLAGVGVTWYTWLEQGRPINASAQVLDAVARTLQLDAAEREHLYQLAEVPFAREARPEPAVESEVGPDVQAVLDALVPLPAVVYNARYDVLATNRAYRNLFSGALPRPRPRGNALWILFTGSPARCRLVFREAELKVMVATLRAAYGGHVGEPEWEDFIRELADRSAEFAEMWASGDVAPPGPRLKTFAHVEVGEIRLRSQSLSVDGLPEARMVVYLAADEDSREKIERLAATEEGALAFR